MNPDFLVTAYPEMIERYYQHNPEIFDELIDYHCFSIFVDDALYLYDIPKDIKGINFMGPLYTNNGKYRLYRDAYVERRRLVEENDHLIKYHGTLHDNNYPAFMSRFEASIVGHAYMAYFSKRVLENAAAGVINCLYVSDQYQKKYYEDYGFVHMETAFFFKNATELTVFYLLKEEQKQTIRANARKLYLEKYTVEKVMEQIFAWINSHTKIQKIVPEKEKFEFKKLKFVSYYHKDSILLGFQKQFLAKGWRIELDIIGTKHPFNDNQLHKYESNDKLFFIHKPRGFLYFPDDAIKIVYIDNPFQMPSVYNPDIVITPTQQIFEMVQHTYPFMFTNVIDTYYELDLTGDRLHEIIQNSVDDWIEAKTKQIIPDKRGLKDLWKTPMRLEQEWKYRIRSQGMIGVQNYKDEKKKHGK